MKKFLILAVAGAVILGSVAVYAGSGCCAAGKSKDKAKSSCADMFSKLDLTDAQKAKIKELSADCDKNGCTAEKHEKFTKGVKEVLTAEQYAKWQADCEKAKKDGTCPYVKDKPKS
jgi:Spy/CpxP family protein refolding chaperone